MENKYLAAKEILKKHGQEHLLVNYEKLSDTEKTRLLDQIFSIDFEEVKQLYALTKKEEKFGNDVIEPIEYTNRKDIPEAKKQELIDLGIKELKEGKYAIVTMAGGQGTRLGHNGPKGTFEVNINGEIKSIFELIFEKILVAKKLYDVEIPWYIMTSKENNNQTVAFFEKHHYFDYPKSKITFFTQGELPMLDVNGKILLTKENEVKFAANGHGGIFSSMLDSGIIFDMKSRGIDKVYISGIDNILANLVDPLFIGFMESNNSTAAGISIVKRNPQEKVGVFCKRNGKPSVIEYTEISEELANKTDANGNLEFGESHVLLNMFKLEGIEKIATEKLPCHVAFKQASYVNTEGKYVEGTEPNSYKFESFIFDGFEALNNMCILRDSREEVFAPIKNSSKNNQEDNEETARNLYINKIERNNKELPLYENL